MISMTSVNLGCLQSFHGTGRCYSSQYFNTDIKVLETYKSGWVGWIINSSPAFRGENRVVICYFCHPCMGLVFLWSSF